MLKFWNVCMAKLEKFVETDIPYSFFLQNINSSSLKEKTKKKSASIDKTRNFCNALLRRS